jgi:hypothetical protein
MPLKDGEPTFDIDVTIKAVTDKALLVVTEDLAETWVPKSQISPYGDLGPDAKRDDSGNMIVSEWIAKQKGWA